MFEIVWAIIEWTLVFNVIVQVISINYILIYNVNTLLMFITNFGLVVSTLV